MVHSTELGNNTLNQKELTVKNLWFYLLSAVLLAGALAEPTHMFADGAGGGNCPTGQMCKPTR